MTQHNNIMLLSYRTMSSTTWISSYIRRPSTNIIMNIGKNNRIQQQLFKTISTIDKRRTISSTNTMILPNKWNTYNNNEASYLVYRNNNNINEHHLLLNRYHTTSRSFSDQTTTDVSKKSTTTTTPYNTNVNNDTTLTKTATSTIVNNTDELLSNNILITIYQYQICPFCNRVKALLDYINIPYRIIEVNPLTKYELKQYKKQKYQKVPILTITSSSNNDDDKHIDNNSNNDEEIAIFGSDEIITTLLQRNDIMSKLQHRWKQQQDQHQQLHIMSMNEFWNPSLMTSLLNTNNKDSTTNTTSTTTNIDWNHYAMETLAPILYPNLCRTISDSYNAFGYVNHVTSFTTIQKISIRLLGSLAMYLAASRVKKKRNIIDEVKAFDDALYYLIEYGLHNGNKQYISDHFYEPNFHDIQIYGILRSIEGCNSSIHTRMLTNPDFTIISKWYHNMKEKTKNI